VSSGYASEQTTFFVITMVRTKFLKFLATISAVLIVFLLLRSVQLIYSIVYTSEGSFVILGRSLALVSYFVLSYLTYKRNIIAAWAMVIFLILSGVSILIFGIFAVPAKQYALKIFGIISGAYFSYGGIIIFRSIRKGEMRGINSLMKKA